MVEKFLEGNRRRYTVTCGVATDSTDPASTFVGADGNHYLLTNPDPATFSRLAFGAPLSELESWTFGVNAEVTNPSIGVFVIELDYPDDGRFTVGFDGDGPCYCYAELDVVVTNARARG